MYTDVNVNISDSQKQKVKKELAAVTQFSLRLSHEDLVGNDVIAVTQSQLNRLKKAHEAGKGVTIKMSKSQVAHNEGTRRISAAASRSGVAGASVSYWHRFTGCRCWSTIKSCQYWCAKTVHQDKKGGCVCEVETDLEPTTGKGFSKVGDGLYLKKERHIYDGKGLLLGPNSPFKNIPILGMLL